MADNTPQATNQEDPAKKVAAAADAVSKVDTVGNTDVPVKPANTDNTAVKTIDAKGKTSDQDKTIADKVFAAAHAAAQPAITNPPGDPADVDKNVLTVPVPDNAVAKRELEGHPEGPLFDPNQIPDHENRIEIGRAVQAIQRSHYVESAADSKVDVKPVKE